MEICIYDAKVWKDEITTRWLGSAIANIYLLMLYVEAAIYCAQQ